MTLFILFLAVFLVSLWATFRVRVSMRRGQATVVDNDPDLTPVPPSAIGEQKQFDRIVAEEFGKLTGKNVSLGELSRLVALLDARSAKALHTDLLQRRRWENDILFPLLTARWAVPEKASIDSDQ